MATTPLAVLDVVPISSGSSAAEALRNSIDLAQAAERLGYARYWFAEHHLNPGVAGTSPAVVLALHLVCAAHALGHLLTPAQLIHFRLPGHLGISPVGCFKRVPCVVFRTNAQADRLH